MSRHNGELKRAKGAEVEEIKGAIDKMVDRGVKYNIFIFIFEYGRKVGEEW
jgi:hypothetical protein